VQIPSTFFGSQCPFCALLLNFCLFLYHVLCSQFSPFYFCKGEDGVWKRWKIKREFRPTDQPPKTRSPQVSGYDCQVFFTSVCSVFAYFSIETRRFCELSVHQNTTLHVCSCTYCFLFRTVREIEIVNPGSQDQGKMYPEHRMLATTVHIAQIRHIKG